jgi:hypothetical protein
VFLPNSVLLLSKSTSPKVSTLIISFIDQGWANICVALSGTQMALRNRGTRREITATGIFATKTSYKKNNQ